VGEPVVSVKGYGLVHCLEGFPRTRSAKPWARFPLH
jgi:hypothetical protein